MSKTEIYYFSGTGNSLVLAKLAAERFEVTRPIHPHSTSANTKEGI
jgi:flavodoxin